jgi:DNA-binding HxlR family transcriptional regulator
MGRTRHAVELSVAGPTLREAEPGPPGYRVTPDITALMPVLGEPAGWASRHRPETPTAWQRVGRG